MTVKTAWQGRILIASLNGEMDLLDTDGLGDALGHLSEANADGVVLDFSGVSYIASIGIGMLLQLAKELRASGMQTRLAAPTPAIRTILETVRIGAILPMDATVEEAIQKLTPVASN